MLIVVFIACSCFLLCAFEIKEQKKLLKILFAYTERSDVADWFG